MRPYVSKSIEELEALFFNRQLSQSSLQDLFNETSHRTTKRANALRERVALALKTDTSPTPNETPRYIAPKQFTFNEKPKPVQPCASGSIKLTGEQHDALVQFATGHTLAVNAFAGSGKTTTLQAIANSTQKKGMYLAFNKAIVEDSKSKFGSNVKCSTIHSVAYRAMIQRYNSQDKMMKRINAHQLAQLMNFREIRLDGNNRLKPVTLAALILQTIRLFSQSARPDFSEAYVPRLGAMGRYRQDVWNVLEKHARLIAERVWTRMADPNDPIPLGHDGYLKLWALSEPTLLGDFLLVDEAQDTNPVVLDVLQKQSSQLIFVGDRYQQIYEWRGAVNAMEKVKADRTSYLTMSFRFGSEIADLASSVLRTMGETRRLVGNPAVISRIGKTTPSSILARTNSGAMTAVIDAIDKGKRPHLVGSKEELMAWLRGVQDLKNNLPSTEPMFFGFQNWTEVLEFVREHETGELTSFVNLVSARGEKQLMWALNRTVDADKAEVVISTAHKAKGREWKNVQLLDDFANSKPKNGKGADDPAEARLFYVAATRAKNELDVSRNLIDMFIH